MNAKDIKRIPIILILGEFSLNQVKESSNGNPNNINGEEHKKTFGEFAWEEIRTKFKQAWIEAFSKEFEENETFENIYDRKFNSDNIEEIKEKINLLNKDIPPGEVYIPPIPIPFDDSLQVRKQPDFKKSLYGLLTEFNILALISCSPAENTIDLFKNLYPLEIPVFITVSSVSNPVTGFRQPKTDMPNKNILRLIPNNDLQAQTILERIFAEDQTNNTGNKEYIDCIVYSPEMDDTYVRDLTESIQDQSKKRSKEIHTIIRHNLNGVKLNESLQMIISVGYYKTLAKLIIKEINKNKSPYKEIFIIQSDGCTVKQAETIRDTDKNLTIYLSRPAVLHQTYAQHAYAAICEVWKDFLFPPLSITELKDIKKRLLPLTHLVEEEIEKEYNNLYYFISNENQKGGYHIEKVGSIKEVNNE